MAKYNIYNQTNISDIDMYLTAMACDVYENSILSKHKSLRPSAQEDSRVYQENLNRHLKTTLSNNLQNEGKWLQPIGEIPKYAEYNNTPEQIARGNFHKFVPDKELDVKVRFIADWIKEAMINDEPWLKNLDAEGNSQTLKRITSLQDAYNKAEKALAKRLNKPNGDIEKVADLGDGYCMVRLLTPNALRYEGDMLEHCIRDGGYDHKVNGNKLRYYSLRDTKNTPFATLEVDFKKNTLLACKGGNRDTKPVDKVIPYLQRFIKKHNLNMDAQALSRHTHLIEVDNKLYDANDVPENSIVHHDVRLTETSRIKRLPDGMNVRGSLFLYKCTGLTSLPKRLKVKGDLDLIGTNITQIPPDIEVGGRIIGRDEKEMEKPTPMMGPVTSALSGKSAAYASVCG